MSGGTTPKALHRPSHQSLLRSGVRIGGTPRSVDAIIVPAGRDASHLRHAADLAQAADAQLIVLCSGAAQAIDVAALVEDAAGLRWFATDLPDNHQHELLSFETAAFAEENLDRASDLSAKRNIGLLLARLLGWERVLFLDDDINGLSTRQLRRAATQLGNLDAVGVHVPEFPDNSVVCHAHRLAGGRQGVFVGGSALAVATNRTTAFFPDVYNEDWLFLFDSVRRGAVGTVGTVTQLAYDPYADLARARSEEFGDVLAEGLFWLLHDEAEPRATDPDFWSDFLDRRRAFIQSIADRLVDRCLDVDLKNRALASLSEAAGSHESISAVKCGSYLEAWRVDLVSWTSRLNLLPSLRCAADAFAYLGLSTCQTRKELPVTAYPGPTFADYEIPAPPAMGALVGTARHTGVDHTATIASTAVIAAPNRKLQEGEWSLEPAATVIGPGADIGHFSLVGAGARVGTGTILDAYVHVEGGAIVGDRVIATHRATIGARAQVGDDSVIGGFVCDRSVVGNGCRIFGALIHRQSDPTIPWDAPEAEEQSPVVEDGVFVGFGAKVIGGVTIGTGAYVCAGAIVTRSVPAHHIAAGVNTFVPSARWNGGLKRSPFFSDLGIGGLGRLAGLFASVKIRRTSAPASCGQAVG